MHGDPGLSRTPMLLLLAATLACGRPAGSAEARNTELEAKGAVLFGIHCARCHGEDGADTTLYPGVKSLASVTRRLSRAEVIEKSRGFTTVQLEGERAVSLYAFLATFQAEGAYPKPELLVDTAWVAAHGADADVRLVDMRQGAAYGAGHIAGAVRLEDGPLKNSADTATYLPTPQVMAGMMGKAGISDKTHVVVYDDQGGRVAARLWYVLNAYGHDKVSLVNGGWNRWAAEKRPTTTDVPTVAEATFVPRSVPVLTCPSTEVLARKPGVLMLDVRSEGEYKTARIPGAVNLDWKENVTGPDMAFKPASELLKIYQAKGVTRDKEIVTHCAGGGRAAQSLFTLKLLGYPKVRVYYGSFADYTSRPEAPVEK